MFSAIYMVCAAELGGCNFFIDQLPYKTLEECEVKAEEAILINQERAGRGELFKHTSFYQCIGWEQA